MTRIYLTCPPREVLVAHAFEQFPDCYRLIVWSGSQEQTVFEEVKHPERTEGVTMNFSLDYLWDMLKADQALFEKAHRGAPLEYVGANGEAVTA